MSRRILLTPRPMYGRQPRLTTREVIGLVVVLLLMVALVAASAALGMPLDDYGDRMRQMAGWLS